MNIYIFTNIIRNYCSGEFYFCAFSLEQTKIEADKFLIDHNKANNNNSNYTIKWGEKIKEVKIEEGFLPLNRLY